MDPKTQDEKDLEKLKEPKTKLEKPPFVFEWIIKPDFLETDSLLEEE